MQSAVILTSTLFLTRKVRIPLAEDACGEGMRVGTKTGSIPAAYREGGSLLNWLAPRSSGARVTQSA